MPVSLADEGDLRRVTADDARAPSARRRRLAGPPSRRGAGDAFVHAADEFYLLCGAAPPASDAPEQYENGIGMSAALLAEAEALGACPEGGEPGDGVAAPLCRRAAGGAG